MTTEHAPATEPQLYSTATIPSRRTLGLPHPGVAGDNRFPLTPEGCNLLVKRGYTVRMESGAADHIHYDDARYARHGVEIVSAAEAWSCDVVIHPGALSKTEVQRLRRGAILLTLFHPESLTAPALNEMQARRVTALALDLMEDAQGNRPFAEVLDEISGRAAVTIGASLLADNTIGKGILLGGIPGIVPCEVLIIGSGIAAIGAARVAMGLGATVRMLDNDVYSLRHAVHDLGQGVIASALHPNVLFNAVHSADIIVATEVDTPRKAALGHDMVQEMKAGVLAFDLTGYDAPMFPSLPSVNLGVGNPGPGEMMRSGKRFAMVNPGGAVARTAAMAMSNAIVATIDKVRHYDTLENALRQNPGMRAAAYIFMGQVVNATLAKYLGVRPIDINIYLTLS